jgi:hypothetical protein
LDGRLDSKFFIFLRFFNSSCTYFYFILNFFSFGESFQ